MSNAAGFIGRASAFFALALLSATFLFGGAVVVYYSLQPAYVVHVNTELVRMAALVAIFVLLYALWVAASPRKSLVVFLRRFSRPESNAAMTGAMYESLRSAGRLVVLDDSVFQPISVPARERLLIVASATPALAGLVLALALGTAVTGPVRIESTGLRLEARGLISITSNYLPDTDLTRRSTRPALLAFPGALGLWIALAAFGTLAFRVLFGSWEARRVIASRADLDGLMRRVRYLKSCAAAPKALGTVATVVRVTDALWQDVVAALVERADVVVLDLSYPTPPILWELEHCLERHPHKLLLIVNGEHNFAEDGVALGVDMERLTDAVAKTPLGGVLVYRLTSSDARNAFHRDLRTFVGA